MRRIWDRRAKNDEWYQKLWLRQSKNQEWIMKILERK